MANINLKVAPESLKSKAQDVKTSISRIEHEWKNISSTILASKGYWEGDASNVHQKQYKALIDEVDLILKRLKEHPDDLLKMANIYTEAEKEAEALANTLPEDIIF